VNKRLGKALRRRPAQSGQVVIEVIVGIIIFTIMLALVMSISVYLYFQQALVTAAREGAREASLNNEIGLGGSEAAGTANIRAYVENTIEKLTGQEATPGVATITVIPPSQSPNQTSGNRTVTVNIQWQMQNPIGIGNMLDALGTDGDRFKTFPVYATATMRYEE
jgi:hypothetical protein